jgi:chromosome segregation ATPase
MKKYLIFLSIFLLASVTAFPQRGGGGTRGRQSQSGQQKQMQENRQSGRSQTDRQQAFVSSQQRKQIKDCSNMADGIRKQARDMAQASGNKFNAGEARQQLGQIQQRYQAMEKEHERLMQGLDAGQRQLLQEQIQNMNRLQSQVNSQLQQMHSDLKSAEPNAQKLSQQAREMERTMNTLKNQYNTLAAQSD